MQNRCFANRSHYVGNDYDAMCLLNGSTDSSEQACYEERMLLNIPLTEERPFPCSNDISPFNSNKVIILLDTEKKQISAGSLEIWISFIRHMNQSGKSYCPLYTATKHIYTRKRRLIHRYKE